MNDNDLLLSASQGSGREAIMLGSFHSKYSRLPSTRRLPASWLNKLLPVTCPAKAISTKHVGADM